LSHRGVPTYVLADEQGVIVANGFGPLPRLRCMAERAVAGEEPTCSPTEWMGELRGQPGLAPTDSQTTPAPVREE